MNYFELGKLSSSELNQMYLDGCKELKLLREEIRLRKEIAELKKTHPLQFSGNKRSNRRKTCKAYKTHKKRR
jgi:hypothetical protein